MEENKTDITETTENTEITDITETTENSEITDVTESEEDAIVKRPATPEELKSANNLLRATVLFAVLAVVGIILSIVSIVLGAVDRFGNVNISAVLRIVFSVVAAVVDIAAVVIYFPLKKSAKKVSKLLDEAEFPDDLK